MRVFGESSTFKIQSFVLFLAVFYFLLNYKPAIAARARTKRARWEQPCAGLSPTMKVSRPLAKSPQPVDTIVVKCRSLRRIIGEAADMYVSYQQDLSVGLCKPAAYHQANFFNEFSVASMNYGVILVHITHASHL